MLITFAIMKFVNLEYSALLRGKGKFEASSKARNDVITFFKNKYKKIEYIPIYRHTEHKVFGVLEFMFQWIYILLRFKSRSICFIQYPMVNLRPFKMFSFLFSRLKIIALIHDLPSYRFSDDPKEIQEEIDLLNKMSGIIVHSKAMEKRLKMDGLKIPTSILNVFDYLLPVEQEIRFKKNVVVFAGALQKSLFLRELHQCPSDNISYNLYGGIKPDIVETEKIHYKGKFVPDNISDIEGEWGLLWDGNSINSCEGNYGRYLEIIAPHKLSLYIACKLKIIVWEGSAMADLVKKKNIGITIGSLYEVDSKIMSLSESQLKIIEENISILSEELREGKMFERAFNSIKEIFGE